MLSVLRGEDGAAEPGAGAMLPLCCRSGISKASIASAGSHGGRRIPWGCAGFLGVGLNQMPPDHSTISRTRRLIDVETHQAVFSWVLKLLAEKGLLKRGKTVGVDGTTLEANAALRSIVRRDTGEGYQGFLTRLAQESGECVHPEGPVEAVGDEGYHSNDTLTALADAEVRHPPGAMLRWSSDRE